VILLFFIFPRNLLLNPRKKTIYLRFEEFLQLLPHVLVETMFLHKLVGELFSSISLIYYYSLGVLKT